MTYKYETHMHTKTGSACAGSSGQEMARAYIEAGYAGMIVTDHFFNGNSAVPRDLPWDERVKRFTKGYYDALEEAKGTDFKVFFAWEWTHVGMDFLTYGLGEDFLYKFPDMLSWSIEEYFHIAHEHGALISQAHPFRKAPHIPGIVLYPGYVDAIEVINGAHGDPSFDAKAMAFANEHNLLHTSGTDSHGVINVPFATGMEFDYELRTIEDFVKATRARDYRLLKSKRY